MTEPNQERVPLQIVGGRILIKPDEHVERVGSIYIPDKSKRAPTMGKVLQVGEGITKCSVGERVLYGVYGGTPVHINGVVFIILTEDEILAKILDDSAKLSTSTGGYESNYANSD